MGMDRKLFAQWSYERDVSVGAISEFAWHNEETWDSYLEEADYYLSGKSPIGWPEDIIERAKRKGVKLPDLAMV